MIRRSAVSFLLAFLTGSSVLAADDPPPGAAAGARIGNAIKTAIDIALPPVGQLISAIWPKKSDGSEKPEAKKADVEKALEAQRKALYAAAQAKVKPLIDVADELRAVNSYLEPTVVAQQSLARMDSHLASAAQPDWTTLGTEWLVAKTQLLSLKEAADARISDFWLRNKLHKIQASLKTQVIRVDGKVTAKNDVPGLRSELEKLSVVLDDVPAAVGYELADLREDLTALAEWAKGGQGSPDLAAKQKTFKTILDARYP